MKKGLDDFISRIYLGVRPLHKYQFAYQSIKFHTVAIHELTGIIEMAIEGKYLSLVTFIDIQGVLDNTSYKTIERAAKDKMIDYKLANHHAEFQAHNLGASKDVHDYVGPIESILKAKTGAEVCSSELSKGHTNGSLRIPSRGLCNLRIGLKLS